MAEQGTLFKALGIGGDMKSKNPMLRWGAGPLGRKCKDCQQLVYHERAKRYYKCKRRGTSSSSATDHRVNWPACTYFVEAEAGGEK